MTGDVKLTKAHTPGPWRVSGLSIETGNISIGAEAYRIVIADVTNAASLGDFISATMRGRRDFGAPDTAKTQWANARLIAAAPDMLAALKRIEEAALKGFLTSDLCAEIVITAIAKAEGRA